MLTKLPDVVTSTVMLTLAISEKSLGRDHPNVATSLENLAQLYRDIGHADKGEPLDKRAAAIRAARN